MDSLTDLEPAVKEMKELYAILDQKKRDLTEKEDAIRRTMAELETFTEETISEQAEKVGLIPTNSE